MSCLLTQSARGIATDASDSASVNAGFAEVRAARVRLDILVDAASVSVPNREKQGSVDNINAQKVVAYYPTFKAAVVGGQGSRPRNQLPPTSL